MNAYVPFVTGSDGATLAQSAFPRSEFFRVPLVRMEKLSNSFGRGACVWIDPGVDGLHELSDRQRIEWFAHSSKFPHCQHWGSPSFEARPPAQEISAFVSAVLDECSRFQPTWISVPQLPWVEGSRRNKLNRLLANAAGAWRSSTPSYSGGLILPVVITHRSQIAGKTDRNPRVRHTERCYQESQANGMWVVDASLEDESGSASLRKARFDPIIGLHEELNASIPSTTRIAGPYWGLNLVLWVRGLVDHPAIGVGSGYQYFLSGGAFHKPTPKIALSPLRRRVSVGPSLTKWLDKAISIVPSKHPAHAELVHLRRRDAALQQLSRARAQVVESCQQWYDSIAAVPAAGRSMALYQDLSAAYALGRSLPELEDEGATRRPESVAEALMLSCL